MLVRVILVLTILVFAMIATSASPALAAGNASARNRAAVPGAVSQPSGELSMIQLQNLVSQRQAATQLTSNMTRAMAAGNRTVIGNIGK